MLETRGPGEVICSASSMADMSLSTAFGQSCKKEIRAGNDTHLARPASSLQLLEYKVHSRFQPEENGVRASEIEQVCSKNVTSWIMMRNRRGHLVPFTVSGIEI